jgi:hypothetical protein
VGCETRRGSQRTVVQESVVGPRSLQSSESGLGWHGIAAGASNGGRMNRPC